MKKQRLLKTLLVAAGLCMGTSAWGTSTRTYDFKAYTESLGLAKNNQADATTHTRKMGRIASLATSSVDFYYVEDYAYNGKTFYFDNRFLWQNDDIVFRNGGTSALQSLKGNRHIAFVVKAGDTFTVTHGGTIKFANPNATYDSPAIDVVAGTTEVVDGTVYTAKADGEIAFSFSQWAYLYTVTINAVTEVITLPSYVKSNGDGTDKVLTITNGRSYDESASLKTYYTTDSEEDPATSASKVEYTAPIVVSSPTTFYFKTVNTVTGVTSALLTVDVPEAGATPDLNAPTAVLSGFSKGADNFYYPVYTFTSDQSGVAGTPAVTYTYSIDAVDMGEASSYTSTAAATLVVTASADGYNSASSTNISIIGGKYLLSNTYNFREPGKSDLTAAELAEPTGGSAQSINNVGCTFYSLNNLTSTFWEGATLTGFVLAVGTTAGATQGIYTRGSAGSITFTLTSGQIVYTTAYQRTGNNTGNAVSYVTEYSTGSETLDIPQYYLVYQSNVYTPVPATVSKTITAAGWATYCSPYALDFTGAITNLTNAYMVTGSTGSTLTLTPITTTIPANTGILLEGSGEVAVPVAASSTTDVSANKLVGTVASTTLTAEQGYVLTYENSVAGFRKNNNNFTLGANTAYLPVNFAGARTFDFFNLEGEATGINAVETIKQNAEGVYNLAGQRVAQPTRGLYIMNGKKYVVK